MTPAYRRATVADLPTIRALGQVVNRLHHEAWPHIFAAMPDRAGEDAHWLRSLQDDNGAAFLACVEDGAVGFVTLRLVDEDHCLLQPGRHALIGTLCVATAMRGRGIGRALMAHAEEWAATHGAGDIRLEVWEFNTAARRLYEELGYSIQALTMNKPLSAATGGSG